MDKQKIKALFDANDLEGAEKLLKAADDNAWALYMLGRIAWKRGLNGEAISYYAKADQLEPGGEAAVALEQARAVMDFFNTDLLNP